ncbi:MAG TPA: T9SS type A sorting domain-containing protein [Prolixibacteraceae bacterium]|nr:T9SS type A sorting domain-containing protein [Prolixibacteraceae bacterium]
MMKYIIILLIIPAITFSQPHDQFKLMDQQGYKVVDFNLNTIANQINEMETNYLPLPDLKNGLIAPTLLDSTRNYHFNTSKDSVLFDRTIFSYNASGTIKNKSYYFWNEYFKKMLNNKFDYLYDKTGNLKTVAFNDWKISHHDAFSTDGYIHSEGPDFINYLSKYEYSYDLSGHQTSFTYHIYDSTIRYWNIWEEFQNYYDAAGIRINKVSASHYERERKEVYSYDLHMNVTTIIQYHKASDHSWFYSGKTNYDYTYDSDFRVTSLLSSYWSFKAGQWKTVSKVEYSYHTNGGLASRLISIIDTTRNELIPANKSDFDYNTIDKLQLRTDYAWNETTSQWELRKKQYHYYNLADLPTHSDNGSLSGNRPFRIFPNPVKDILWIENTSKSNSSIHIYNNKGQCVKTDVMKKGLNTINLIPLPKGLYIITMPLKNELKSFKLIVE